MEQLLLFTGKDLQDIHWNDWLAEKPEELHSITTFWFDVIKNCGPDVEDIFHDNYPIGCVESAPFAYINAFKAHVNLGFFYGVDLPDPEGLLEGTGKRMRHIKLRPGAKLNTEAIRNLVVHAYADIKQRLYAP